MILNGQFLTAALSHFFAVPRLKSLFQLCRAQVRFKDITAA